MGADEIASSESETRETPLSDRIEEKLDHGWRIESLPDGQLLLIPPPNYGEPPAAA